MNKKGFYLIFFVIFSIVVLLALLAAIMKANNSHDKIVGLDSLYLSKIYDEGEKIKFYLDRSVSLSESNAIEVLKSNAGYATPSCPKFGDYVLLSSDCGDFDPEKSFEIAFSSQLKNYLSSYSSTYIDVNLQNIYESNTKDKAFGSFFRFSESVPKTISPERSFVATYSESQVNSASFVLEKDIISFNELSFKTESLKDNTYSIAPKYKLENIDLEIYDRIYAVLASSCMSKTVKNCIQAINKEFGIYAEAIFGGNLVRADINGIKIAFDVSSSLPQKLTFREHTIVQ